MLPQALVFVCLLLLTPGIMAADNSTCSLFCKDYNAHIITENGQGTLMVDGVDIKMILSENTELKAQVTEAFGQIGSLQGATQAQQACFDD